MQSIYICVYYTYTSNQNSMSKETTLSEHLKKVLEERKKKDGADWYQKSCLRQVGLSTKE